MKTVTAKELKNKAGDVIKSIRQGEEIMVSYRGKPLGKFVPIKKTSILSELSGIIKNIPDDIKQIRKDRLKDKYEDIYWHQYHPGRARWKKVFFWDVKKGEGVHIVDAEEFLDHIKKCID